MRGTPGFQNVFHVGNQIAFGQAALDGIAENLRAHGL